MRPTLCPYPLPFLAGKGSQGTPVILAWVHQELPPLQKQRFQVLKEKVVNCPLKTSLRHTGAEQLSAYIKDHVFRQDTLLHSGHTTEETDYLDSFQFSFNLGFGTKLLWLTCLITLGERSTGEVHPATPPRSYNVRV